MYSKDYGTAGVSVCLLPHLTHSEIMKWGVTQNIFAILSYLAPPTVESVMAKFISYAKQWRLIAEKFEFDEDLIDEIDTNNSADESCLYQSVELWVTKFHPSWEKVDYILNQLGKDYGSQGKLLITCFAFTLLLTKMAQCWSHINVH